MLRIIILLIGFSIGAGLVAFSFKPMLDAEAAQGWPMTAAYIRKIGVTVSVVAKPNTGGSTKTKKGVVYQPDLVFEYDVSGYKYSGSKIQYTHRSYATREEAAAVLAAYGIGELIFIHYNPAAPDQSVLNPIGEPSYLFTYFGGLLAALSLWFMAKPFLKKKEA